MVNVCVECDGPDADDGEPTTKSGQSARRFSEFRYSRGQRGRGRVLR